MSQNNFFVETLNAIKTTENQTDDGVNQKDAKMMIENFIEEQGLPVPSGYSSDKSNFYRPFINYLFFNNKLNEYLDTLLDAYNAYGENVFELGVPSCFLRIFDTNYLKEQQVKSMRQDSYGDESYFLLDILQNVIGVHIVCPLLNSAYKAQANMKEKAKQAKIDSEKARANFMKAHRLTQQNRKTK